MNENQSRCFINMNIHFFVTKLLFEILSKTIYIFFFRNTQRCIVYAQSRKIYQKKVEHGVRYEIVRKQRRKYITHNQ